MLYLPAEEATGSPPLGQLMGRLAGRVAATLSCLIQAHEIIQEVHLTSTGVTLALYKRPLPALLMLLLGMQARISGNIIS